jgi:hypothetical protein
MESKIFENTIHLAEMSMLCTKYQNEPFIVWIGGGPHSNFREGGQSEHNPPHIHVLMRDGTNETRIRIDNTEMPTDIHNLFYVEKDIKLSNKVAKDFIKWLAKPPLKVFNAKNNWEASKLYWIEVLQTDANKGQVEPINLT